MNISIIAWITLAVPLLAAALIVLVTRTSKPLASGLAITSALIAFVGALILFASGVNADFHGYDWISLGKSFSIPIGLAIDPP